MSRRKPPRHWLEHVPDWREAPMAYWVHIQPEGEQWPAATTYVPPAPPPDGANGYRLLCVESQGFVFTFSSEAQLDEAVRVLAQVPLPTSSRLSARRHGGHGPNSHWLSRLPGTIKSPKARRRAVEDLEAVRGRLGRPGDRSGTEAKP